MIHYLADTTTSEIGRELSCAQEHYTLTTGRVLTLVIVATVNDDVDAIVEASRDASHEHPSRVLILLTAEDSSESYLDAELHVGGEAGASEIVVMTLNGEMAQHPSSIVTPLLLPDTPIVAWWPQNPPRAPRRHPIGMIAQRRITSADNLADLAHYYCPGDSDTAWSAITTWRGIVASAVDRHLGPRVTKATISGDQSQAVDIAAGWLADSLGVIVSVETQPRDTEGDHFPIDTLVFDFDDNSTVEVSSVDQHTVGIDVPGSGRSLVALNVRSTAECLSEELRHIDPDETYGHALQALAQVRSTNSPSR